MEKNKIKKRKKVKRKKEREREREREMRSEVTYLLGLSYVVFLSSAWSNVGMTNMTNRHGQCFVVVVVVVCFICCCGLFVCYCFDVA